MSVSLAEQQAIFGLEEPVMCKCGREFKITSDRQGFVKSVDCTCGIHIEVGGKLVLIPALNG